MVVHKWLDRQAGNLFLLGIFWLIICAISLIRAEVIDNIPNNFANIHTWSFAIGFSLWWVVFASQAFAKVRSKFSAFMLWGSAIICFHVAIETVIKPLYTLFPTNYFFIFTPCCTALFIFLLLTKKGVKKENG